MKKVIILILAITLSFLFVSTPVFAENSCGEVSTNIINCGSENGITRILNLVIEILSVGIGILGVIGISIVGIQYLTAGGNEEKTRKAKRRMFEIILGLAAYAVLYALLKFLGVTSQPQSFTIIEKIVLS